ncbi:hypothetical protein EDC04DRAFT_3112751 [Pisolithus marmoratus]|nr:hypothetical protein EDC04DRAFT_3112751 [Pisolithus marmoratus]
MDRTTPSCTECASKLSALLAGFSTDAYGDDSWRDLELIAQHLANSLRKRHGPEDYRTPLGSTTLPQDLTSLLHVALNGAPIPDDVRAPAVLEILRVGANLCVDHDQNRGNLLEAGFPQAVVSLLEGYSELVPSGLRPDPLPLSIPHLEVIKIAIGVLLNTSLGFNPVKFRLISLEVAMTLVRLSSALYPVGSWMRCTTSLFPSDLVLEETPIRIAESWNIRIVLSNWAWRLITELRDDEHPLFDPQVLPHLVQPLIVFTPPLLTAPPPPDFAHPSPLRTSLLQADFELLSDSCSQLESLALDVEDVRLSLARGFLFPTEHQNVPCLTAMLDFIEQGSYAPLWYVQHEASFSMADARNQEKAFDDCKAAVIKAVVEMSGEDKNIDVLVDESDPTKSGGPYISRMVNWIRHFVLGSMHGNARDDLVICATLSLGNLVRREFQSTILLSPPHNIAQLLSSEVLLSQSTDIKLKHGVIGLLKHLSQASCSSAPGRIALTNAKVIERVLASGVLDERSDAMADVVQVNAIGIVKHLCNGSLDNSLKVILPAETDVPLPTGLSQVLSLVKRSDKVVIKSEGTRIIVNLVKSLWSSDPQKEYRNVEEIQIRQQKRDKAITALLVSPSCIEALTALLGRSHKYPVLVNEAVVALSLLSTHRDAGPLVLRAIVAPLPAEVAPGIPNSMVIPATPSTSSEVGSPIWSPGARHRPPQNRTLDHLVSVLRNSSKNDDTLGLRSAATSYPSEVRANVCSLFGQVTKHTSGEDVDTVKDEVKPVLEELCRHSQDLGRESMLGNAARRVLDMWAQA